MFYYIFIILDPVLNVKLSSTNLTKSVNFWKDILSLKIFNQTETFVELGFGDDQAKLILKDIGKYFSFIVIYFVLFEYLVYLIHQFNCSMNILMLIFLKYYFRRAN